MGRQWLRVWRAVNHRRVICGGCEKKASEMKEAEEPTDDPAGMETAVAENGGWCERLVWSDL